MTPPRPPLVRHEGHTPREHGVGLAKKMFLRRQMGGGSYALMQSVKRALDPMSLLNPGKIFDL